MPAIVLLLILCSGLQAETLSSLALRGYNVIPQPQRVEIAATDVRFGPEWTLESAPGVAVGDVAIETLESELQSRYGIRRTAKAADSVRLTIAAGAVQPGKATDPDKQA